MYIHAHESYRKVAYKLTYLPAISLVPPVEHRSKSTLAQFPTKLPIAPGTPDVHVVLYLRSTQQTTKESLHLRKTKPRTIVGDGRYLRTCLGIDGKGMDRNNGVFYSDFCLTLNSFRNNLRTFY